jgi:hypothetical protein
MVMDRYYTIRIVLVFDGFYTDHFEPRQNMRNSFFFWILVFSMSKKTSQTLGRESHTFVLRKSQTTRH